MLVTAVELWMDLGDTVLESTRVKNVVVLGRLRGPHLMHQVYILCWCGVEGGCEGGNGEGGGRGEREGGGRGEGEGEVGRVCGEGERKGEGRMLH